jgi:hypothetical protein
MLVPNPQGRLQPGSFARGRILTRIEPAVTFVPDEALVVFAGVTKVYTVADGKAVEKKIEPGQHIGDEIEVISGLAGVQPIVINGKNKLATGTPITETATTRTFSTRRSTTRAN